MSGDVHVRFCEGVGVRLPRATPLIITGRSQAFLADEVQPLVAQCLAERGLARSGEKTRVTHIEEGFDCLGPPVRKYRGTLLCTPAKQNVQAFLDPLRGIVQGNKHATTGHLLRQLQPVMRGGAQYHQHGASKRPCARVDQELFTLLWQWARRRPLKKSRHWIRDQSFRTAGENHWVCFGQVMGSTGKRHDVRLWRASRVPMRRHTKITGEANPYDPPWEPSCAARQGRRMAHNRKGRRYLLRLWTEQDGRCGICHQRIPQLTGWHSHHLVWRTHRGSDRAEHRVLLHPNCPAQVHSRGLTVVKPRPPTGVGQA
jgi:RNA-directed DNA polymerase